MIALNDIVQRLLDQYRSTGESYLQEAAAEIERLREDLDQTGAALRASKAENTALLGHTDARTTRSYLRDKEAARVVGPKWGVK